MSLKKSDWSCGKKIQTNLFYCLREINNNVQFHTAVASHETVFNQHKRVSSIYKQGEIF